MTEQQTGTEAGAETGQEQAGQQEATTFSQADVERIVRDRLAQQAKNKFGDYDELKVKADGAKTLEERLASVETELSSTKASALRSQIASEHGISTKKGPKGEPSPAEVLLTGADEAAMTAQAKLYADAVGDRKKNGNVAPNEGDTKTTGDRTEDHEFVSELFGRSS